MVSYEITKYVHGLSNTKFVAAWQLMRNTRFVLGDLYRGHQNTLQVSVGLRSSSGVGGERCQTLLSQLDSDSRPL